ncbi:phage holin family protein [Falsirhodobacter sp. alg1]|uniref:phage holin family protein n=1 Tax=Falsirhodobacter sp. alg1 TaxID=1472418 RepID=UPI0005EE52F8|nr:phage holin family protein [Falsirhodobacter sp. alg1]
MDDQVNKSATNLVGDLVGNVNNLFRKEIQLLRAEASEKATQAVAAVGQIAAGLVIVLVALIVLAFAIVAAIHAAGLSVGWSALIVGGVFAVIALILISKGVNDLKATNLAPARTADSVSKDAAMIKDKV